MSNSVATTISLWELIGQSAPKPNPQGIAFHPNGNLYAANEASGSATGSLSVIESATNRVSVLYQYLDTFCEELQAQMGIIYHWRKQCIREQNRFNHFLNSIEGINTKTLAIRLHQLEEYGLVKRKVIPGKPAHTEYSPTEKGMAVQRILAEIASFITKYEPEIIFVDKKPRNNMYMGLLSPFDLLIVSIPSNLTYRVHLENYYRCGFGGIGDRIDPVPQGTVHHSK